MLYLRIDFPCANLIALSSFLSDGPSLSFILSWGYLLAIPHLQHWGELFTFEPRFSSLKCVELDYVCTYYINVAPFPITRYYGDSHGMFLFDRGGWNFATQASPKRLNDTRGQTHVYESRELFKQKNSVYALTKF